MSLSISSDSFDNLLYQHFGFLIHDYGWQLIKIADKSFLAESKNARIRIFIERNLLVSDIEPIGESANIMLRANIFPSRLRITNLREGIDSNLNYRITWLNAREMIQDIPAEIQKISELLRKYCDDLLRGDFSAWPRIKESVLSRRGMK